MKIKKRFTVIAIFCLFIIAGFTGKVYIYPPDEAGIIKIPKPEGPLSLKFDEPGDIAAGDIFQAKLKIHTIFNNDGFELELTVPDEVELISGPEKWKGSLTAKKVKTIDYQFRLLRDGEFVVKAMGKLFLPKSKPLVSQGILVAASINQLNKKAGPDVVEKESGEKLRVSQGQFLKK